MTTVTVIRSYEYEVVDARGKKSKGKIDAPNETAVALALRDQGATPIKIAESNTGLKKEIAVPGLDRVTLKDLAIFTRQFATMASSGLSLLRSLAILEEQTARAKLAKAIRDVRRDVESGSSLAGALGRHDKIFPRLMVAMINAGETGGFIDSALDRIAQNFEKEATLRAKVKSAMTYPVIVLCFSVLMVTGVLLFIVPIFSNMFKSMHAQLPLPTEMLVVASNQAVWIIPIFLAVVIGAIIWFRARVRADREFRLRVDRIKLRLPVFGKLLKKIALSRWSRNLATLLTSGVPIMQALDIVGDTSGNEVVAEAMTGVKNAVRDGQPISTTLSHNPIFPSMVVQMVEVGEESGQLSAMLEKAADFYDREVETATEQLAAAIEPVMVVLMGGIVGTVVVALYLPMFTIYQHIQGAS